MEKEDVGEGGGAQNIIVVEKGEVGEGKNGKIIRDHYQNSLIKRWPRE